LIRLADIRLTERDKIKMGECFRLGDLVKAKVVSHGLVITRSHTSISVSPSFASSIFSDFKLVVVIVRSVRLMNLSCHLVTLEAIT
jgi:exosome complex RNA-binding protein Csl4